MRYIYVYCMQPKNILAKPVLGRHGEILLQAGVKMKPNYINSMKKLGIRGAYIHDSISEDLEIVNAISEEVRSKAVKSISATFSKVANGSRVCKKASKTVMKLAEDIVDDILKHGDVMLNLFDMKVYDNYTFFHSVNVTVLSVIIGMGLSFSKGRLVNLAYAALLHDIGKMFINKDIINKNGPLTEAETEIMRKHPQDGYGYIKAHFGAAVPEVSLIGILHHHERFDGKGYPDGKACKSISEFGRILSIADVYDALVSDRPYRQNAFPVEAMEYIQGGCDTMFDIDYVNVFSRKVALFPTGTMVELSDGSIALVMENFEGYTQRPRIKVIQKNDKKVTPYFIDLRDEYYDVTIVAMVDM